MSGTFHSLINMFRKCVQGSKTIHDYEPISNPIGDNEVVESSAQNLTKALIQEISPVWVTLTWGGIMATVFILVGNFHTLVTLIGLIEYTFFFLTVLGLIILRIKDPELARPYKPPVLIPILFCIVSAAVVLRSTIFAPLQALVLALTLLGGGMFFYMKGDR